MTIIAQRKQRVYSAQVIRREDPDIWKNNKRSLYIWAENRCKQLKIKQKTTNLLKIIISVTNLKNISVACNKTMLELYNNRHPEDTISPRTFDKYINTLVTNKLIKRYDQKKWNSSCATRVLAPKLVVRSAHFLRTNTSSLEEGTDTTERNTPVSASASTSTGTFSLREVPGKDDYTKPLPEQASSPYAKVRTFDELKQQRAIDLKLRR